MYEISYKSHNDEIIASAVADVNALEGEVRSQESGVRREQADTGTGRRGDREIRRREDKGIWDFGFGILPQCPKGHFVAFIAGISMHGDSAQNPRPHCPILRRVNSRI